MAMAITNHIYKNIMEDLVNEEIARQLSKYHPSLFTDLSKVEVSAYVLNRLPVLYASSEEGLLKQKIKAKKDFSNEIRTLVIRGLARVMKNPNIKSMPLTADLEIEREQLKKSLEELKNLYPNPDFSWQNLVDLVKKRLSSFNIYKKADRDMSLSTSNNQEVDCWAKSVYIR